MLGWSISWTARRSRAVYEIDQPNIYLWTVSYKPNKWFIFPRTFIFYIIYHNCNSKSENHGDLCVLAYICYTSMIMSMYRHVKLKVKASVLIYHFLSTYTSSKNISLSSTIQNLQSKFKRRAKCLPPPLFPCRWKKCKHMICMLYVQVRFISHPSWY